MNKIVCKSHLVHIEQAKVTAQELYLCLQSGLDIHKYLDSLDAERLPEPLELSLVIERAQDSFHAEERAIAQGRHYQGC